MRESIGATWIFTIVIVFILLFTSYLAISVNYARAFKFKNRIVTIVENSEGFKKGEAKSKEISKSINNFITKDGYDAHGRCPCNARYNDSEDTTTWTMVACIGGNEGKADGTVPSKCADGNKSADCGVAIYRADSGVGYSFSKGKTTIDNTNPTCAPRSYYRVVTFFRFDLPVIGYFTNFKVSGETKTIYDYANAVASCKS